MGGAGADTRSEGFEALADGYNEGAWNWRTVDPGACEVLGLEAGVGGHLQ